MLNLTRDPLRFTVGDFKEYIKMEKWVIKMKKADFQAIAGKYHISPIVARLIRNRDVINEEDIDGYLNGTLADLHDGMRMRDMDKAVEILSGKVREGAPIRVIGDYDIDGVNATYILQEGLMRLGAKVDTDIPDRVKDGYGLNQMLVDRALEDGIDTIITCDNGIAAAKEIAYGKERGLTIVVTDHHEVPYDLQEPEASAVSVAAASRMEDLDSTAVATPCVEDVDSAMDVVPRGEETKKVWRLPPADAVVDPRRADCNYPFKELCGAAVAYKLVEALYKEAGRDVCEVADLMENVAVATVGDIMDLVGENRIIVKHGLEMLKKTNNQGLKALMECTGVPAEGLSAYHIGFIIGPCINAGGRLDTAKRALELLNAKTRREAVTLAEDLKALNDSRKEMTEKGVEQAIEQIEGSPIKVDKVLVVYLPDCHESVAGIIAGRIREKYYRPVFVLTRSEDGVKGSGRSIERYHMFEEMSGCKELFTKFGGHKMAAGLSLPEENVERFRTRINELASLTEDDLQLKVSIDMMLPISYISKKLIEELKVLEPHGKGNAKPLFVEKNLRVINPRIIGKNQNVLKFRVENEKGLQIEAIYFGDVQDCLRTMERSRKMAFTYYPTVNEYRGMQTLQMNVVNYRGM